MCFEGYGTSLWIMIHRCFPELFLMDQVTLAILIPMFNQNMLCCEIIVRTWYNRCFSCGTYLILFHDSLFSLFPKYWFIIFLLFPFYSHISLLVLFFLWQNGAIADNMCTVDAPCPTGPSRIKGYWLLMAHNSVPLQELSWAEGYTPPWGQPASKNAQTICLSLEQLWRIIPAPKLCVGSTEASLQLHYGSPSPLAFPSAFLALCKCCSPEHPTIKLLSKNVRITGVCFPGIWPLTLPNKIRKSRGVKMCLF